MHQKNILHQVQFSIIMIWLILSMRSKQLHVKKCSNHCKLTVNTFDGGRKFIGGNRCERAFDVKINTKHYNLYEYKNELIGAYINAETKVTRKEVIGIPLGLNMYELLPFTAQVIYNTWLQGRSISAVNTKDIYKRTAYNSFRYSLLSAKLLHGHIEELVEAGVDTIFYPCMSYNIDEHLGDNHYNCPVVAYYPEVIQVKCQSNRKSKLYL